MAQPAPEGRDVTDLKFKLQSRVPIFRGNGNVRDGSSLLAAASVYGLVIAGTNGPELKVLQLKDVTQDKVINEPVPLRSVPLPSEPYQLAISCDHGFLAVDIVANGVPFIYIYSVASFLTPAVMKLHEIRTAAQPGVRSTQILWNPVIHNMFSVRTENGGLSVYTLKEPTGLVFNSLDASVERTLCACWSPKGKQLVVAYANGKLVQYKPDLTPAKTIPCPPGILAGTFDALAVQWLSTYQFAAVFMLHGNDSVPSLFIINAPKAGAPVYINYDDICYSQSGPRKGQVFLQHILPWNLLLMATSNSMEVGILGTTETSDAPTWTQWTTTDEARAELPLTVDKQETFPVGFALETGCTHEIVIGEQTFPTMPMIHLLSTYGQLVSFNILNTLPQVPSLCSPPRPVSIPAGLFVVESEQQNVALPSAGVVPAAAAPPPQVAADMSFAKGNMTTSTPAIPKTKSFFSPTGENKSPVNLFGSSSNAAVVPANPHATAFLTGPTIAPTFGKQITFAGQPATATGNNANVPLTMGAFGGGTMATSFGAPTGTGAIANVPQPTTTATDLSKPLVTVPTTFVPPQPRPTPAPQGTAPPVNPPSAQQKTSQLSTDDSNAVIRAMISDEIKKFSRDMADLKQRSGALNTTVGTRDDSGAIEKNLQELENIIAQADESTESLISDVQALRLGMSEAFAMVAEASSKNDLCNNPGVNHQFQEAHAMSQTCRRQLTSLQNMLSVNENQLRLVMKQIDAQWASFEHTRNVSKRNRMQVPSLEVLYQTLARQQEILNRQREKINYVKAKVGLRESTVGSAVERAKKRDGYGQTVVGDATVDSLTDSIISLSIGKQVQEDTKRLSESKMHSLRQMLEHRKVVTITPRRPDRVGLSSEVVRERKAEVKRQNLAEQEQRAKAASSEQQPKAAPVVNVKQPTTTTTASATATTKPFTFATGSSAPFTFGQAVKPTKPEQPVAKPTPALTPSVAPSFTAKESTEKGNFNVKPQVTKENAPVPSTKPMPLFSFNSNTTIQAVPKTTDVTTKSVFSFGGTTAGISFGNVPSFSLAKSQNAPGNTFGSVQPKTAGSGEGPLNLGSGKDKDVPVVPTSKADKPTSIKEALEAKKDEPLKPTFGPADSTTKAPLPALTSLLQKVDAADTAKSAAPLTPSVAFGNSTISSANSPIGGLFSSVKSTTSSFGTTITPVTATNTTMFGSVKPADPPADPKTESSSSFGAAAPTTGFSFGTGAITAFGTKPPTDSVPDTKSILGGTVSTPSFGSVIPPVGSTTFATPFATPPAATATPQSPSTTPSPNTSSTGNMFGSLSFGKPQPTVSSTAAPVVALSTPNVTTVLSSSDASASSTVSTTTVTTATTATTDPTANLFGSFNICSPTGVTTGGSPATGSNIFGSASFEVPKSEGTTSNAFSSSKSLFGGTKETTTLFGAASPAAGTASPVGTGLFGSVAPASTAPSMFGGTGGLTATTVAPTVPVPATPFGGTAVGVSGGSFFGAVGATTEATVATGAATTSVFGGNNSSNNNSNNNSGNAAGLFAAVTAVPATNTTNIFGSTVAASPTSAASGGGLFSGSNANNSGTAATGGLMFGGSNAYGGAGGAASSNTNIFGVSAGGFGASTAFSQTAAVPAQSTQSIFGGAAGSGGPGVTGATSAFGGSSFSSPSSSGGPFSQGAGVGGGAGSFASPSSSAFNKPTFGGAPSFGGTPTFGGTATFGGGPTFGGSPTFGSPKTGFSGFNTSTLGSPTQSNNLFEQLGSSSTGVSFGGLAQQSAPKQPQFGGSSFSSWRS